MYVFGKDRVIGGRTETFGDVESNDSAGYMRFRIDTVRDMEFQLIYSKGLDTSPDEVMGTRTTRASEGRNVSSGSKWKHRGQSTDTGDVICAAIEYDNEQLTHIAAWPVLQCYDASTTHQEVVRQL